MAERDQHRRCKRRGDAAAPADAAAATTRTCHPGAGGRVGRRYRLLPTHDAIMTAARTANLASGGASNVAAIAAALSPDERARLEAAYPTRSVEGSVAKILPQLTTRGLLTSPGRGWRRYYGVPEVLAALGAGDHVPEPPSRRQAVLRCLQGAAGRRGGPVRHADVLHEAIGRPDDDTAPTAAVLTSTDVTRGLASLVQTGDAVIVCTVRGGGASGRHLYLPADMARSDPILDADTDAPAGAQGASGPVTFITAVEQAFVALWNEETSRASAGGALPRPIATRAVRDRLAAGGGAFGARAAAAAMHVINGLQTLARGPRPAVRAVLRRDGHRALLWGPASVADAALDLGDAYASDAARLADAVRRCAGEQGAPAVTRAQVAAYARRHPALQPTGRESLPATLSRFTRKRVDGRDGGHEIVSRPVVRVGRVGAAVYYAAPPGQPDSPGYVAHVAAAAAFVRLRRLEAEAARCGGEDRVVDVGAAVQPAVQVGRACLIAAEAEALAAALAEIAGAVGARPEDRGPAADLQRRTAAVARLARQHADSASRGAGLAGPHGLAHPSHPDDRAADPGLANPDPAIPGITTEALAALLAPYDRRGRKDTRAQQFSSAFSLPIRRVPNPAFASRRLGTAEFLFDRFDALTQVGVARGGGECAAAAALARHEMERLRDARYCGPGLADPLVGVRLAAVACLAYLQPGGADARLRGLAVADPEPGARRAAWWALGFLAASAGVDGRGPAEGAAADPSPHVRALAHAYHDAGGSWWAV